MISGKGYRSRCRTLSEHSHQKAHFLISHKFLTTTYTVRRNLKVDTAHYVFILKSLSRKHNQSNRINGQLSSRDWKQRWLFSRVSPIFAAHRPTLRGIFFLLRPLLIRKKGLRKEMSYLLHSYQELRTKLIYHCYQYINYLQHLIYHYSNLLLKHRNTFFFTTYFLLLESPPFFRISFRDFIRRRWNGMHVWPSLPFGAPVSFVSGTLLSKSACSSFPLLALGDVRWALDFHSAS